jgi:glycosyltransferase involved in cell wall biosynthesis
MHASDVFIHHSVTDHEGNEEGLPVAILEAMADGLPVVSTRHAGIPEAVQEGVTGYLVEEGDSAGMSERLMRLASDGALRRTMGEAGWSRARECYTWETERARLRKILGVGVWPL